MSSPIDRTGSDSSRIVAPSRVATAKPSSHAKDSSTASTGSNTGGDTVNLTGNALMIQQVAASVAAAPIVDSGRVDSIRQAISSGQYVVDSSAVASKLIAFEHRLGSS